MSNPLEPSTSKVSMGFTLREGISGEPELNLQFNEGRRLPEFSGDSRSAELSASVCGLSRGKGYDMRLFT